LDLRVELDVRHVPDKDARLINGAFMHQHWWIFFVPANSSAPVANLPSYRVLNFNFYLIGVWRIGTYILEE